MKAEIVANAQAVAEAHGLKIEYIRRKSFRKEACVREILAERGDDPGLVHIFSATERLNTFRAGTRKDTGHPFIAPRNGQCLHYYFYFIDPDFGLCYLRVPTWAPFRLQFYFNGHNWLARQLKAEGVDFTLIDNAFVSIADADKAQAIIDSFPVRALHSRLDDLARLLCPVIRHFHSGYHWSLMQVECATDLIFSSAEDLAPLFDHLVRTAAHAVKVDQIATFLGRRLDGRFAGEIGNRFHTRIQGTSIRHHMGRASIKMYDKIGRVLRIETTVNDVTIFKHHRNIGARSDKDYKVQIWYRTPRLTLSIAFRLRRASRLSTAPENPGSRDRLWAPSRTHRLTASGCFLSSGANAPDRWPHLSMPTVATSTLSCARVRSRRVLARNSTSVPNNPHANVRKSTASIRGRSKPVLRPCSSIKTPQWRSKLRSNISINRKPPTEESASVSPPSAVRICRRYACRACRMGARQGVAELRLTTP